MEKSFVFKFMGLNFELSGIIGSTLMALAVLFICIWLSRKVEMKPNKRQNVFSIYLISLTALLKIMLATRMLKITYHYMHLFYSCLFGL